MDIKEIEKTLKIKQEELIKLMPEHLQEELKDNMYLSGGCIYSLYHDQEPNDYDVFIRNEKLGKELMEYFKSQKLEQFKNILQGKYKGLHLLVSKYAITLGNFQIVIKYIGKPIEVVNQFDFKHNMFYYDDYCIHNVVEWTYLDTNKVYFNENRARDLCGTLLRIAKFSKRGMIVSKREVAKILHKLDEKGFDDREKEIIHDYTTY
jgi:hypothetical protein